ncbi:MAG: hypothetical protein GF390_00815 [Candidatus Pacebacteria bacterium]|nr:hypothetical protein [Candidatus Paceibacterota bacterium]
MSQYCWQKLTQPILGLAPMDGVSDHPFRQITKKYGQPDLIYTEFCSVEALCRGQKYFPRELFYDHDQQPIIAQVYGQTPRFFRQVAVLLCQLGFAGIDLNMGCPSKNVTNSGAGAGLIKTPLLAQQIIQATQAGVEDWLNGKTVADCADLSAAVKTVSQTTLPCSPILVTVRKPVPVSIKTRLGYKQQQLKDWLPRLLAMQPAAIALHGRTFKQGYSGQADWSAIGQAVELAQGTDTLILGNGNVQSRQEAVLKAQTYGVAGVLIGRASWGNPWVFQDYQPSLAEKIQVALEHCYLYEQTFHQQRKYSFAPMRKHLGWYVKGFSQAKALRVQLFQTNSPQEVKKAFEHYKA